MRSLWHSTAPWGPSSYSVLTKRTVPDIVRAGHDVLVGTWYGLQGEPQQWRIRPRDDKTKESGMVMVMPLDNGQNYGVEVLLASYEWFKADILISCMDVFVLPAQVTSHVRFCPWVPIDHDPLPQGICDALSTALYPMSFSKWGGEILATA